MTGLTFTSIGQRIGLGLLIIIGLMAVADVKAIWSILTIDRQFQRYAIAATALEQVEELQIRVESHLVHAKDYAARNTDERRDVVNESYRMIQDDVTEVERDQAVDLSGIRDGLTQFHAAFNTYADLRRERTELVQGPLLQASEALRSGDVDSVEALRKVAEVQEQLQLFLVREDTSALDEAVRLSALAEQDFAAEMGPAAADLTMHLRTLRTLIEQEAETGKAFFETERDALRGLLYAEVDRLHQIEYEAAETLTASKESSMILLPLIAGLALLAAVGVIWWLSIKISRPLKSMTGALVALSQGDLDQTLPATDRKDELGEMYGALQRFLELSRERRRLEIEEERGRARARHRQEELDQLVGMFGKSIDAVLKGVEQASVAMGETARDMKGSASGVKTRSDQVLNSAERMTQSMQAVAAATQELSSSISEIGQQAERAGALAGDTKAGAASAGRQVRSLADMVGEISSVAEMISAIAEQTNLLALNATIESARAGDAGKGFAVVAQEVKALAQRTTEATAEIQEKIETIQGAARTAVGEVEGMESAIDNLDGATQAVAAATVEQQAATAEIARTVGEVTEEAEGVRTSIGDVQASGEHSVGSATIVEKASGELEVEAGTLAEEVRTFLDGISDGARRETIERRSVRLSASVEPESGAKSECNVVNLSAASAEIDAALRVSLGTRVTLHLPGCRPVLARIAQVSGSTTTLQLPMDRDSLDQMNVYLKGLANAA